jgi:hypothetical protein
MCHCCACHFDRLLGSFSSHSRMGLMNYTTPSDHPYLPGDSDGVAVRLFYSRSGVGVDSLVDPYRERPMDSVISSVFQLQRGRNCSRVPRRTPSSPISQDSSIQRLSPRPKWLRHHRPFRLARRSRTLVRGRRGREGSRRRRECHRDNAPAWRGGMPGVDWRDASGGQRGVGDMLAQWRRTGSGCCSAGRGRG